MDLHEDGPVEAVAAPEPGRKIEDVPQKPLEGSADAQLHTSIAQQGGQLSGIRVQTEEFEEGSEDADKHMSMLEYFTCGLCCRTRNRSPAKPKLEFMEQPAAPSTTESSRQPTPLPARTKQEGESARRSSAAEAEISEGPIIKNDEVEDTLEGNLRHSEEQVAVVGGTVEQQDVELSQQSEPTDEIRAQVEQENKQLEKDIEDASEN